MYELVAQANAGPNWAEQSMVWITAASVLVSAAIAFFAVSNGKEATRIAEESVKIAEESKQIAQDAAEREGVRLEREQLAAGREARDRVALAMLRAFSAADYVHMAPHNDPQLSEAKQLSMTLEVEASSLIKTYTADSDNVALRQWFTRSFLDFARAAERSYPPGVSYRRTQNFASYCIELWTRNVISSDDLLNAEKMERLAQSSNYGENR